MSGIDRIKGMYEGRCQGVPVCMFFSTEYMCRMSGVQDYNFLYGPHDHRAQAHISMTKLHDLDGIYLWPRGKRRDWREDYRLVKEAGEPFIRDVKNNRRLPLSEDYYAICFPEKPPYRNPFIQYGESQEIVNGVPYYSKPKLDIGSIADVDRLLPLETADRVAEGGMLEGIRLIADAVGREVFLEGSCNSSFRFALGIIGLQEGLMFMQDEPEVFSYLLDRVTAQELEYLKVMASFGIHSAWINDIWVDLISEADYRKYAMPCAKKFIGEAKKLGIKSHYFPTGKTPYVIECVNELKPDALHLEEFSGLDIGEIRRRLDKNIVLYGNLHATEVLLKGPASVIEDEVKRQIDKCLPQGPFIMSLGSEVPSKTPCEFVDAMIHAAHSYK